MPNVYIALKDLEKLFQSVTLSILGFTQENIDEWNAFVLNGRNGEAPVNPFYFVRISWPVNGAPAWKITENVAFIRIFETDNYYNKQRDVNFVPVDADNGNMASGYTRVISCNWVFYGPDCFDNAQKLKSGMFLTEFREKLADKNLYMIPDIQSAVRIPELFQDQWWDRTDLTINFNNKVIENATVPFIKEAEVTTKGDL